jgi:hypothetical protein
MISSESNLFYSFVYCCLQILLQKQSVAACSGPEAGL